jgi:V/A-type H+-transporting ATPase subunit I
MKTLLAQSMRRIELVVPERDVVPVTEALAATGSFHLTSTRTPGVEDASLQKSDWHEQAAAFMALEQRVLKVMEALGVNEGPPPSVSPHLIWPDVAQTDVERLEQETQGPVQELEEEQRSLDKLQRYLNQLKLIVDLDVDLDDLRNPRYTFLLSGRMPTTNIERLQSSLEHIPSMLVPLHHEDHLATVVLIGLQRDADILNRAARSAYLNPLELPEAYRGTPAQAIVALEEGIERRRQHIAERRAAIEHLHETHIRHLRHLLWRVRASRTLAETIAGYGRLRYTYLVAGWVPTPRVDMVRQEVQQVSDRTTIEVSPPRKEEKIHVPVALDNPPPIRAFQGLVTIYAYPCYGEIDPTAAIALTFPLIFGIMFGDVGHGLLLSLLGLLLTSRKIHALRGLASLGPILVACGVVAAFFGFLYGSIFGFEDILTPLWIRPLEAIMDILLTTVGIGVGLLNLGMIYNIVNAILARRWGRLLFDHNGLAGLMLYWSLIGLAAGSLVGNLPINPTWPAVLAAVSGLAVAFSELLEHIVEGHRPLIEDSFGTYLMQALFELFETVIGFLSNTLSYVRMGAFAVAHGALSMVVFIIAEIISPAHGVGYWIVVALGNLFVIGFEGMLVGIQTLRLEYYEFFSKFFSGGGVRYRPLALIPRHRNGAFEE